MPISGASGGIRTHPLEILSLLPLPLGYTRVISLFTLSLFLLLVNKFLS